jgi:hypothetical protein
MFSAARGDVRRGGGVKMRTIVVAVLFSALCALNADSVLAGSRTKPKKTVVVHDKAMMAKLRSLVIKHIDLDDVEPSAVFKLLRIESKKADPEGKGVNFLLTGGLDKSSSKRITLSMADVPLSEVVRYVRRAAGRDYVAERYAVVIKPKPPKKK